VINGDSDGFGELGVETSFLELSQAETSADLLYLVVAYGLATYHGAELLEGSRVEG
jgi:hypothetical protein